METELLITILIVIGQVVVIFHTELNVLSLSFKLTEPLSHISTRRGGEFGSFGDRLGIVVNRDFARFSDQRL